MNTKKHISQDNYEILEIQCKSINGPHLFKNMLNVNIDEYDQNTEWNINALGVSNSFKITIQNKIKLHDNQQKEDQQFSNDILDIQIYGFDPFKNPQATMVVPLLNLSNLFKKNKFFDESAETDIILGLSLAKARRYLQSSEIFYNVSKYYATKSLEQVQLLASNSNQSLMQTRQNNEHLNFCAPNKYLLKASKVQLLGADAIKQPSMINEKLYGYIRATEFYIGKKLDQNLQISSMTDIYSTLIKHGSYFCKFLIKCCFDPMDAIKFAGLRGIEFIIEQMGSQIGSLIPVLLKSILITYPTHNFCQYEDQQNSNQINFLIFPLNQPLNSQNQNHVELKNELMGDVQQYKFKLDLYNSILESFLNMMNSCSSSILSKIFADIIQPNLFINNLNQDVKLFLFKMSEKIIQICQGDLNVNLIFIQNVISTLNIGTNNQIKMTKHKLWDTLKNYYIIHAKGDKFDALIDWIYQYLISLSDFQQFESVQYFQFQQLLHIISSFVQKENHRFFEYNINKENTINENLSYQNNFQPIEDFELMSLNKQLGNLNFYQTKDNIALQMEMQNNFNNKPIDTIKITQNKSTIDKLNSQIQRLYKYPYNKQLLNLIHPLINWIENSLQSHKSVEMFQSIWEIIINFYRFNSVINEITLFEIISPLLQKFYEYLEQYSPTLDILNVLIIIFKSLTQHVDQFMHLLQKFLIMFSHCVPHSIFDETFIVFDILVKLISGQFNQQIINGDRPAVFDGDSGF